MLLCDTEVQKNTISAGMKVYIFIMFMYVVCCLAWTKLENCELELATIKKNCRENKIIKIEDGRD